MIVKKREGAGASESNVPSNRFFAVRRTLTLFILAMQQAQLLLFDEPHPLAIFGLVARAPIVSAFVPVFMYK